MLGFRVLGSLGLRMRASGFRLPGRRGAAV